MSTVHIIQEPISIGSCIIFIYNIRRREEGFTSAMLFPVTRKHKEKDTLISVLLFASGPFHGEISTPALALNMPSFVLAIQSGYIDLTNGWGGGEMVGKTIIGGKTF